MKSSWLNEPNSDGFWWVYDPAGELTVVKITNFSDAFPIEMLGSDSIANFRDIDPYMKNNFPNCKWLKILTPEVPA